MFTVLFVMSYTAHDSNHASKEVGCHSGDFHDLKKNPNKLLSRRDFFCSLNDLTRLGRDLKV